MLEDRYVFETMHTQLKDAGWTLIVSEEDVDHIWLAENLECSYENYGLYWYFEDENDAMLFMLRWA